MANTVNNINSDSNLSQETPNLSVSNITVTNQIYNTSLYTGPAFKTYACFMTQSDDNDPVVDEIINEISPDMVWARLSDGHYVMSSNNQFPADKRQSLQAEEVQLYSDNMILPTQIVLLVLTELIIRII